MLKLIKYLKPYSFLLIMAIFLLFVQAMSELALPNYMSDIVNTGIQQGGIETAVPKAMRKSTMDKITLFMDSEEKDFVLNNYEFVDSSSENYDKYLEEYPALENENIYVLKDISNKTRDELIPILGKTLMTVSGIQQAKENAEGGVMNLNGMEMPANLDVYNLLKMMPESQRQQMTEQIDKQIEALGEDMVNQAAVAAVEKEYVELGLDVDKMQNDYILSTGFWMLMVSLLSAASTIVVSLLSARIGAGAAKDIRYDVFSKVENFSNSEFVKFSTASLITRTTNDIIQIQLVLIMMIRMVFYAPIMGTGGIIRALDTSPSMSWIIVLAVIVLLGLIAVIFAIALPKFKKMQKLIDRLNLVTRENLSGMMVIRAFNTQKFEEERFDKANTELTKTQLFINRVMVSMMPIMMFIMNGVMVLIVWIGAHQISESSLQVGDMMAYMQYAMQIIFSFLMLSAMFIILPRATVSANRIKEVLDVDPEIKDPENPKNIKNPKGLVEFKNVSYKFPHAEEPILKNISFTAEPGKTTAIIGSTGSGKSTLVNMIPRFYDATEGQVLIDGIDVREITQNELRKQIGYVPQRGVLFSGDIESNLKYADKNAPEELINKAIDIAQAREIVEEKEEGIHAPISQGGSNVSGGQKQRLSIARALVKKPNVFIFDDSFSALDFKTDSKLRKKLKEETGNSTLIIVAQRIATIKNAEQIIVLDEGKIVGKGTHNELMESCETYKEIALSQLSREELE
ncbi:ABC transporter ATP-binding protein [Geotoga petraea]|jgi:ATP-binding cassette subfamily B protein|uniref:ABC transporter ATP-binding protein n=1 Tax=Geotoga petraea TaxID=28234 RepID=A0A1G6PNQ6_9BACT|nr:ABC transporter ATP-binding protein [Geotoga petraea]MDK2946086.1 ATP-binding cassette, subfamily multidrug efflux pump [Geotoga sp.]TGG87989.1 ABC transporter ATP-binding protein [Geotoga petraea]SDC81146.1 ATP-binding cassette, subfamily B [Geotoga petraea]